ncbi:MAG: uracil-DNA glycosylase [Chloroflexi bacterium]|nr:uracil-DNA glycosylase [Chloroflexota bacterium]
MSFAQASPLAGLSLAEVAARVLTCTDCPLSRGRTHAVPGEGAENARVLFIGEGPGWHEDQTGRPFVGPAGKFLDELIASAGLKRPDVFITNVVKCRPPGNRDPLPDEIDACRKYLDRQLEIMKPDVVVTLGRHSMARFFPGETISRVHGTWRRQNGLVCFAMYHPAAALHQQSLKTTLQTDILKLPGLLQEVNRPAQAEQPAKQLNLF